MQVDVRQATHPEAMKTYDTDALRRHFLIEHLFQEGQIALTYWHTDRLVVGGAVPTGQSIKLETSKPIGQDTFLAERELGIINLGGAGRVVVDNTAHDMARLDCLYVGRGALDVRFQSAEPASPARFYLVSAPTHVDHPIRLIKPADARRLDPGESRTANKRTIFQYIHPETCASGSLVMGATFLEEGSVWNTMPAHTHDRRCEAYLYFDIAPEHRVFHFMGEPHQTRHLVVADGQAVLSPPWSIHSGAGTTNYAFVWAMAGDNKNFTDMDHVAISDLR